MNLNRKAGLAAGVLAGVTMLIAPAAFAANTASVDGTASPVGDVAVTGTNTSTLAFLTNSLPGIPMSCTGSSVSGAVKRGGSVTAGQTIGKISNLSFGSPTTPCTMTTLNYPVLINKNTNPGSVDWPISVTATPAKGAATVPIRIDNIDVKMKSASRTGTPSSYICDLRAQGSVTGTFNQTTQQITINPPTGTYPISTITAYDGQDTNTAAPSGITCAGMIFSGDGVRMTGSFSLSTPLGGGLHW